MIIGFDGSRAFNKDRTGTENYSFQLLMALAELDHKNNYIVYLREVSDEQRGSWPANFQFKVIKWPRLWTQGGLAKQTFTDRLDVLFIPAHTSPMIHKPGLKTVVTVHDLGAEYLPKMHQLKQRLYLKWITNYQLKNATKLIAVSKATKDDLVKRIGIDQNRIKVVYEGYDTNLTISSSHDSLVDSLNQFALKPQQYFLFVGTIQPRKNLARLIEAFAKFRDQYHEVSIKGKNPIIHNTSPISLVVAGGKGWFSDEIYKLPKKLGIEDKVKFLGRVDDEQLKTLYQGAIALTFPSLFEGFGLPILEAQSLGCPVITSNLSSMPEVAGKGAILVDPYSVEQITKGMELVIGNKAQAISLVKKGKENVKRFSWEKAAKETLEVLESV